MTKTDLNQYPSVLVTGASTGIGRTCCRHLAERGWRVFGSVRREEDAAALRDEDGVEPLLFDVTDTGGIAAAKEQLVGILGDKGLSGLVNNAGIAVAGPLEFLPIEDWRSQFEVNVIGQVAVTQAFLPLLRKAKGRIVNMSSISGRIAIPLLGPYAGSKHALEALSDALRAELKQFGMQVSIIEPGVIKTPIWDKSSRDARVRGEKMPEEAWGLYGELIAGVRGGQDKVVAGAVPPEFVARAVFHALTARRPKTRYLVGTDAKIQARVEAWLPDRLFDWLVLSVMRRMAKKEASTNG